MARNKTWAVDLIRRNLPSRDEMEKNRFLRPIAHLVLRPELWRFTRRSVPRGAAVGMAVGIILLIPFSQFVLAALFCLPFRANIPIAIAMTLFTNPLTTPLFVLASLWVGNRLFGFTSNPGMVMEMMRTHAPVSEWWAWLWSSAAPGLVTGLLVIGAVSAVLTYLVTVIGWRIWIARKWRARGHQHIEVQSG